MQRNLIARFSLSLALATALSVSPALAQGKGKGQDKERAKQEKEFRGESRRPELRRRTEDRREQERRQEAQRQEERRRAALREEERRDGRYDERYDERYEDDRRARSGRSVPPGWCKGRGNPHNTPENCGYGARGRNDRSGGVYDSGRVYDDRVYDDRDGRSGSYDADHREFHRYLDQKYAEMARQRSMTDINWQLHVRNEKRREHDAWHARAGRAH